MLPVRVVLRYRNERCTVQLHDRRSTRFCSFASENVWTIKRRPSVLVARLTGNNRCAYYARTTCTASVGAQTVGTWLGVIWCWCSRPKTMTAETVSHWQERLGPSNARASHMNATHQNVAGSCERWACRILLSGCSMPAFVGVCCLFVLVWREVLNEPMLLNQ